MVGQNSDIRIGANQECHHEFIWGLYQRADNTLHLTPKYQAGFCQHKYMQIADIPIQFMMRLKSSDSVPLVFVE